MPGSLRPVATPVVTKKEKVGEKLRSWGSG